MSKVDRFWSHEANNIRCVRASDYDRDVQALQEGANDSDAGLVLYMEKSAELAADNERLSEERDTLAAESKRMREALQLARPIVDRACQPVTDMDGECISCGLSLFGRASSTPLSEHRQDCRYGKNADSLFRIDAALSSTSKEVQ